MYGKSGFYTRKINFVSASFGKCIGNEACFSLEDAHMAMDVTDGVGRANVDRRKDKKEDSIDDIGCNDYV